MGVESKDACGDMSTCSSRIAEVRVRLAPVAFLLTSWLVTGCSVVTGVMREEKEGLKGFS